MPEGRTYCFQTEAGWASATVTDAGLRALGWPGAVQRGQGEAPTAAVSALFSRLQRHWAGQPQRYDDVELPQGRLVDRLRAEQDRRFDRHLASAA